MKIDLIKKKSGKEFDRILFEQYKIITTSADKITDKRHNTNKFYLGINSFLFTVSAYLTTINRTIIPLLISIVGFIISIVWNKNIESYKSLNSAKFRVIHELEQHLPANIYKKEDEYLKKNYYKLTSIEKWIPFIFALLYATIIIIILWSMIKWV
ncbi:hypothetical protein K9M79_01470 [Candidatus Woesearchaeota archaeon]|nr:hypothetical protein [Candidatus Woesearchaeota archaeon]